MDVETVGQQLRQAREARSLTIEQVSRLTHMRVHYLQALEAGDLKALPSLTQARGFLRAYAEFLKLDPEPLLAVLSVAVQSTASPAQGSQQAGTPVQPEPARAKAKQPRSAASLPAPAPARNVEPAAEAAAASQAIFNEIGQRLQRQREQLGLSLDDVERHTHLRRHYLRALESGSLDALPSPVQGRGMLNNYAAFLGMDPEPLLLRFAEGLQTGLALKQAARQAIDPAKPGPARRKPVLPPGLRRLLSSDVLLGISFGVFLIAFMLWGGIRIFALRSGVTPEPTAPSIADVLLASPSPTVTPSPTAGALPAALLETQQPAVAGEDPLSGEDPLAGEEPLPEGTSVAAFPTVAVEGVQVYVTVVQRTWMRAVVDGKVEFEGRVLPGSAYSYSGKKQVEILTGNGAGLHILFNQRNLGQMGLFGQVVDRIYTAAGILEPTPTPTFTPTATGRVTATPQPSVTPTAGTPTAPALP